MEKPSWNLKLATARTRPPASRQYWRRLCYLDTRALMQGGLLLLAVLGLAVLFYRGALRTELHPRDLRLLVWTFPLLFVFAFLLLGSVWGRYRHRMASPAQILSLSLPLLALLGLGWGQTASLTGAERLPWETQAPLLRPQGDGLPALPEASQDPAEELPQVEGAHPLGPTEYPLWLLRVLTQPEDWQGGQYTFLGRTERTPEGFVLLGRPVLLCCAADARPLGLRAVDDPRLDQAQDGWWYFTVEVTSEPGLEEPVLRLLRQEPAPVPRFQYAYFTEGATLPPPPMTH